MPRDPFYFRNTFIRMKFDTHYSLADIAKAIVPGPPNRNHEPSRWVRMPTVAALAARYGGVESGEAGAAAAKRSAVLLMKGRGGSWAKEALASEYALFLDEVAGGELIMAFSTAGGGVRDRDLGRPAKAEPPSQSPGVPGHLVSGYVKPEDFVDTFTGQPSPFYAPEEVLDPATGRRFAFSDPALLATFTPAERAALEAACSEVVVQLLAARAAGNSPISLCGELLGKMRGLPPASGSSGRPFTSLEQPFVAPTAPKPVHVHDPNLTEEENMRRRGVTDPDRLFAAYKLDLDKAWAAKEAARKAAQDAAKAAPKVVPTPLPPRPKPIGERMLERRPSEPQDDLDEREKEEARLEGEAAEAAEAEAERARLEALAAPTLPEGAAVVPEGYYGFVELPESLRRPSVE